MKITSIKNHRILIPFKNVLKKFSKYAVICTFVHKISYRIFYHLFLFEMKLGYCLIGHLNIHVNVPVPSFDTRYPRKDSTVPTLDHFVLPLLISLPPHFLYLPLSTTHIQTLRTSKAGQVEPLSILIL